MIGEQQHRALGEVEQSALVVHLLGLGAQPAGQMKGTARQPLGIGIDPRDQRLDRTRVGAIIVGGRRLRHERRRAQGERDEQGADHAGRSAARPAAILLVEGHNGRRHFDLGQGSDWHWRGAGQPVNRLNDRRVASRL